MSGWVPGARQTESSGKLTPREELPMSRPTSRPTLLRVLGAGRGRGAHDPAIGDIGDGGCVASPTWQTSGLRLGEAD